MIGDWWPSARRAQWRLSRKGLSFEGFFSGFGLQLPVLVIKWTEAPSTAKTAKSSQNQTRLQSLKLMQSKRLSQIRVFTDQQISRARDSLASPW